MIFTAQYRYSGPGRVDITYKTTDPFGKVFAPTQEMVYGYKYHGWSEGKYTHEYQSRLATSALSNIEPFNRLCQVAADPDKYLVLVCYCAAAAFCHRLELMTWMHSVFGMDYAGEVVL